MGLAHESEPRHLKTAVLFLTLTLSKCLDFLLFVCLLLFCFVFAVLIAFFWFHVVWVGHTVNMEHTNSCFFATGGKCISKNYCTIFSNSIFF